MSDTNLNDGLKLLGLDKTNPRTHPTTIFREGQHIELTHRDQLPFRFHGHLGHGGYATVDIVEDPTTGRIFARKLFKRYHGRDFETWSQKVRNEIEIIKRLKAHPHVVQLFGTYSCGRELGMLLLPVANEGDMQVYLQNIQDSRSGITEVQRSVLWNSFGCLLDGLAFIHRNTIRHKDIKPNNILVHNGRTIYTDFGISLDATDMGHTTTTGKPESLTRRYCAPEVANNERRNRKTDVFSLGCVFVEIMAVLEPSLNMDFSDRESPFWEMAGDIQITLRFFRTSDHRLREMLCTIAFMVAPTIGFRFDSEQLLEHLQTVQRSYQGSDHAMFCNDCLPNGSIVKPGFGVSLKNANTNSQASRFEARNSEALQLNNKTLPPYRPLPAQSPIATMLRQTFGLEEAQESYIYIVGSRREQGLLKIGRATDVRASLEEWERKCKHPVREYERVLVKKAKRVESLVTVELKDYRFYEQCEPCLNTQHAWYRTTPEHAAKVIRKFCIWMERDPYRFDRKSGLWELKEEIRPRDLEMVCRPVYVE